MHYRGMRALLKRRTGSSSIACRILIGLLVIFSLTRLGLAQVDRTALNGTVTDSAGQGLRNYWMGHAGNSMDDLYDKIKEDVAFRTEVAEQCGFGFELPSVVPNVPKITEKTEAAKAA